MTFLHLFLKKYLMKSRERDRGSEMLKGRLGEMEKYLEDGNICFQKKQKSGQ